MSRILQLVQLLAQLGPIIDMVTRLIGSSQLGSIFEVLRKLAEALQPANPPASVQYLALDATKIFGDGPLNRDQLRAKLDDLAMAAKAIARVTPWETDDAIAEVLAQAVQSDWLLDLIVLVLAGRVTAEDTERAMAEWEAGRQAA